MGLKLTLIKNKNKINPINKKYNKLSFNWIIGFKNVVFKYNPTKPPFPFM